MKDEIKEILDFKEDGDYKRLSVDEMVILKDYITNLEKLNENRISESLAYDLAVARVKELEYRIDKAVEYIENDFLNK